jgi:ferredoxin-NADP reductase
MEPEELVPAFRPGQFLHLALDAYDPSKQWPESRVFSIASSPARSSSLRITFAVKGRFTERMAREAGEGSRVWLKLPFGSFTMEENGRPKALIAGGTGITPFVSFLEYAVDTSVRSPIFLYYGVRTPDLIIYDGLLKECGARIPGFTLNIFVERETRQKSSTRAGRLDIDLIASELSHENSVEYYISGPYDMVKNFRLALGGSGIDASRIFIDDWG